jgi:thiosulfate/3-mercaptopyruvate sulfurtransferase
MQTMIFSKADPRARESRHSSGRVAPLSVRVARYNPSMPTSPLIDASSLARHLGDSGWVIVDCRFTLTDPPAGRAAYSKSHIPGARYADLDRELARRPGPSDGRHPLPRSEDFATRLGSWGVGNDSTVVAYDEGSGAIAARLWWMLHWLGHEQALVLDGGFAAWEATKLPVETDAPHWQPARFVPRKVASDAIVSAAAIPAILAGGGVLVDARGAARYRGEQEPIDPVAGHVPGAVNRPFTENVTAAGRFKPGPELEKELRPLLGGREPRDLVAMCGSGVTACHLLLAMAVAGLEGGKLYAGSWSEWIRDPNRPIRTGPAP